VTWQETLREDPVMAELVDRHGAVELSPADDEFARLCRSIIDQQLSTASADAVRGRVFGLFDGSPTPEAVLAADRDLLREAGLSRTKTDYLKNAAGAFRARDLTREGLADHSDEEVVAELTRITGVGDWTARMYLVFALGREDVLALGDLGIRRGIQQLYGDGAEMTREEMRAVAEPWRPYRSYAMQYLWRAHESD
jgi:DNA-3-methyladenine glycosylase II